MQIPFNPPEFKPLSDFLSGIIKRQLAPGLAVFTGSPGEPGFLQCLGHLEPKSESPIVQPETMYDLASLTKPLATSISILQLCNTSRLSLHQTIDEILPEYTHISNNKIQIEHLLTHTSGLPDWYPLYKDGIGREAVLKKLLKIKRTHHPGKKVVYSCIGYILLGEIIRRITQSSLADYTHTNIFKPLEMHATEFLPSISNHMIAPTEEGNRFEETMARKRGFHINSIREHRLIGEVHDGNAFACDGEGGNAGLFSTLKDLIRMGSAMIDLLTDGCGAFTKVIPSDCFRLSIQNRTLGMNESRGLGWQLKPNAFNAGNKMNSCSFGHTGFTGTSFWIDPIRRLLMIMLSNRVYWGGGGNEFAQQRPRFHDLAITCWDHLHR